MFWPLLNAYWTRSRLVLFSYSCTRAPNPSDRTPCRSFLLSALFPMYFIRALWLTDSYCANSCMISCDSIVLTRDCSITCKRLAMYDSNGYWLLFSKTPPRVLSFVVLLLSFDIYCLSRPRQQNRLPRALHSVFVLVISPTELAISSRAPSRLD
jgi:hypothetical protein